MSQLRHATYSAWRGSLGIEKEPYAPKSLFFPPCLSLQANEMGKMEIAGLALGEFRRD